MLFPLRIPTRKVVIVALLATLALVVYFFYPITASQDQTRVERPIAQETVAQPSRQPAPARTDASPEVSRLQREKEILRDEFAQVLMEKTALSARLQEMEGRLSRQPVASAETAAPKAVSLIEISLVDIQENLVRLGYNPGPVDGRLGPLTKSAIREFHDDLGIIAGQMSLAQLFMALETYKEVQEKHKDWVQIFRNEGFRSWLEKLPPADAARYKSTMRTGAAREVIELLNKYNLERRAG